MLRQAILCALAVCVLVVPVFGNADVSFTNAGNLPLDSVIEHHTYTIELWLTNHSPSTTALSAYQFQFNGGDFLTGKLDATNWSEGSVFNGLSPAWSKGDQLLDTASANYSVDGYSSSLSTPFVGPALPLDTPVLLGTFQVYIDALKGDHVSFLLGNQSGIDDQNGNLAGAGLGALGVSVPVTPEPASFALIAFAAVPLLRRRAARV